LKAISTDGGRAMPNAERSNSSTSGRSSSKGLSDFLPALTVFPFWGSFLGSRAGLDWEAEGGAIFGRVSPLVRLLLKRLPIRREKTKRGEEEEEEQEQEE